MYTIQPKHYDNLMVTDLDLSYEPRFHWIGTGRVGTAPVFQNGSEESQIGVAEHIGHLPPEPREQSSS